MFGSGELSCGGSGNSRSSSSLRAAAASSTVVVYVSRHPKRACARAQPSCLLTLRTAPTVEHARPPRSRHSKAAPVRISHCGARVVLCSLVSCLPDRSLASYRRPGHTLRSRTRVFLLVVAARPFVRRSSFSADYRTSADSDRLLCRPVDRSVIVRNIQHAHSGRKAFRAISDGRRRPPAHRRRRPRR